MSKQDLELALLHSDASIDHELARQCLDAQYEDVFTSELAKSILPDSSRTDLGSCSTCISERIAAIAESVEQKLQVLVLGVTLLNAFLQVNYTGPALKTQVDKLLPESVTSRESFHGEILDDLIVDGERPYPLVEDVVYLWLAIKILNHEALESLRSQTWWKLRVNFIHQKLLDDPVSTIHNIICDEDNVSKIENLLSQDVELKARWHLELAHYYSYYSYDQKAMFQVKEAQRVNGLHMQVSGALGRRTKFQQFDISQLVVLARSTNGEEPEDKVKSTSKAGPQTFDLNDDTLLETVSFSETNVEAEYSKRYINPVADVVPVESLDPELANIDPGDQPQLNLVDQCVLLAYAGVIKVSAASDDQIIIEQVAAYVARVLHKTIESGGVNSNWTINSAALLARSRIEGHRSRTVERSVLQLQALVDQLMDEIGSGNALPQVNGTEAQAPSSGAQGASFLRRADQTSSAPPRERLSHLFCLSLSSKWDMQAELAGRYTSIGLVRSALEIFERLEKWDQVALCYGVMDQEEKAEKILRTQLELARPGADIPKLWCLLGDVTRDPSYWEKSWEVSGQRYARAQRSLGKSYFAKKDYPATITAYAKSLKINPLNHGAWFIYGCAGLESGQFEVSAEAFTRCISIDAQDGEAWNNLASSLLRLGRDRRRDAWKALKTATGMKYDSWRMWENYMLVSLDLGEYVEVVRSMRRVIEIRADKGEEAVDLQVLTMLVQEVVGTPAEEVDTFNQDSQEADGLRGLPRMVNDLMCTLIRPLITREPRLWTLLAKVYLWRHRYADALDAHEKSYRCLTGKLVETEYPVFQEVVAAVEDLVDAYRSLGPMEGRMGGEVAKDWKFKSRSVVRTLKGRGSNFQDTPAYEKLNEILEDLKIV